MCLVIHVQGMSIALATLNFDLSRSIRAQTMCFEFRSLFIKIRIDYERC